MLDRVPEDEDALAALEGIYRRAGDNEALYEILVRRAELARRRHRRPSASCRLQIGALAESPLERLDEAIAAYERVLEISRRTTARPPQALDRLYTKAERWGDLTRLLEDLLKRGVLPERDLVGIRFRMAQIEHDRQNDREAALEHLRLVLSGDPDHPGAITMLEGMLDDIAVQGQAAELLEPVYAGRADWTALIKIGEIRLVQVEDPAERLAWTKRIARLFEEQLEDYDSALRWYGKVFQEAPTERLSLEQLVRLADKLDRWADLASLLSNYLEGELGEEPAVIDIVRRTAEIFDHRLGQRPEAEKYYRRLFDARPDDREVGAAVRGGAGALGRLAGAARADRRGGGARGRSGGEAGAAAPEREARRGEAGQPRARDRDAARGDGRRSGGLAARPRSWNACSAPRGSGTSWPITWRRRWTASATRARPTRSGCGSPGSCTRSSTTSRRRSIATPRSWNGRPASRTPSRRWSRWRRTDAERHRIAVILEPVYRQSGDLGKLVGALEAQLESVDDRTERVRILREMAEIHQRLGRPERAFECRSRAWLTDVESGETLAEMERWVSRAACTASWSPRCEKGAVEAGDPEPAGAAVGDDRPAARGSAGPRRRRDRGVAVGAGGAPRRSGRLPGPGAPAVRARRARRSWSTSSRSTSRSRTDAGERKAIAKRIAVLYEDALKQREQAVRAWETVLEIDPAGRRRAGCRWRSCTRPAAPTAS